MEHKYACVLDTNGFYKTFVLLLLTPQMEGEDAWIVQYYELNEGERLVDTMPPLTKAHAGADGLIRPKWENATDTWTEGATEEEIAAWEQEHPAPEPPPPTAMDKLQEENHLLAARVAALSEQNDFQEDLIVELAGVVYA